MIASECLNEAQREGVRFGVRAQLIQDHFSQVDFHASSTSSLRAGPCPYQYGTRVAVRSAQAHILDEVGHHRILQRPYEATATRIHFWMARVLEEDVICARPRRSKKLKCSHAERVNDARVLCSPRSRSSRTNTIAPSCLSVPLMSFWICIHHDESPNPLDLQMPCVS